MSATKLLSGSSSSNLEDSPVHAPAKLHYCGVGPCRPKSLQRCASAKIFTLILCLDALIEGALVSGKSLYQKLLIHLYACSLSLEWPSS